jgi:hypothetical protein
MRMGRRSGLPAGIAQPIREPRGSSTPQWANITVVVKVLPARLDWLRALAEGDEVFSARFGISVVTG